MSLPKNMNAITLPTSSSYSYANPAKADSLILNPSFPAPSPNPNQALIRVHATGISPYELTWQGSYILTKPRVPCYDIAGTIVSAPSNTGFVPGDAVFGLIDFKGQGGLAEYVVADPRLLARIPEGVGFVEAASLPRAALTAWQAVKVQGGGVVREGMTVLVTGASGAVGRMGVQVLRNVVGEKGRLIAVGGEGSEELAGLGADVTVNYRSTERGWEAAVRAEGSLDVVFDCIGGKMLESCLDLVKDGGHVITIGSPPPVWQDVKGWQEARIRGVKGEFFIVKEDGEQLGEIGEMLQKGAIRPSISVVVGGLTQDGVRNAWTRAEKGGLSGSVVVKVV